MTPLIDISVITVTYNDEGLIDTLDSVLSQKLKNINIEHIIVDNLSKNGSDKIVKKYVKKAEYKVNYIREPDTGIYDAMNKAIKKSRGKYLFFLNGNDYLYNQEAIINLYSNNQGKDIIYGNINILDSHGGTIFTPPENLDLKFFLNSALPHQATLIHKKIFNEYGLYNEDYSISSDHNYFTKIICKYNATYKHVNKTITNYYFNGQSSDTANQLKIEQQKNIFLKTEFSVITQTKIENQKNSSCFETPILFIIFNRPDTTKIVFEKLKELKPKYLYVVADGPRKNNPKDEINISLSKEIIKGVNWQCQLTTLYRTENFGCGNSVSKAINWFFENENEGIILEDDCVPEKSFFEYCSFMLNKFRDDDRVGHINGMSIVKNLPKDSYYYSRYFHVWGWATWRRAWKDYDFHIRSFPEFRERKFISSIFPQESIQEFWNKAFMSVHTHRLDTWDYQWVYTNLVKNRLSIMPSQNMISNIGFGNNATHTSDSNNPLSNLSTSKMVVSEIKDEAIIIANQANDNQIYKKMGIKTEGVLVNQIKKIIESPIKLIEQKLGIKKHNAISKRKFLTILSLPVWLTSLFLFARHNVRTQSFWYDESGQFWISQGLNHFSKPFSPIGSMSQVIINNNAYNLDPGGFSMILHYWLGISTKAGFLRLLPFLAFVTSCILLSKIVTKWRPHNPVAYFSGLVLIVSPLIKQFTFELGPYSFEMLAIVTSLFIIYYQEKILSKKLYSFIAGICFSALVTSRYSAIISIIPTIVIMALYVNKNRSIIKEILTSFLFFIFPFLTTITSIFYFSLRFQNPHANSPFYVSNLMLKNISLIDILSVRENQFTIFPFLVLLMLFIISIRSNYLQVKLIQYRKFIIYTTILNLVFITLSILGKYPWAINSRWDISTHTLFIFSWIPLILLTLDIVHDKNKIVYSFSKILILILFINQIFVYSSTFKYGQLDTMYENVKYNNPIPKDSKVLINVGAVPSLKYLYEYGAFKNNHSFYPNFDTFNHGGYNLPNSLINLKDIDDYDYILLSHFDYQNSEIKKIIEEKHNWENITISEPSIILKNKKR